MNQIEIKARLSSTETPFQKTIQRLKQINVPFEIKTGNKSTLIKIRYEEMHDNL